MKKRIVSLLCVLALCLGLLPTTALAAGDAPNSLYVGDQQVINGNNITYWTTDSSTGGLTEYEGNDDNWNVKYDPSTVTLTLKNATIKGVYNNVNTSGSGIYAASSSGPVSLNIVLEEENKVSGMYGINVSSSGGDASLNISGSGSLTVSGLSGNGIGIFMSSQNSANLTIEEASVTALGSQDGGSGVRLITSQTGSPSLTIEVKGGSLQASGETNGIHFLSNVNDATAVANMKVSGNAMVKASNIITTKDGTGSAPELKPAASGSDGTGGIIWDGKNGTVYGDVTLQEDLEIGEGESLTISDGASLETNGKLTVNGGTLNGKPNGNVIYKVTGVNLDQTAISLAVGGTAALNATITPANATNQNLTWSSDNTNVATVASGTVTAVGTGSTNITVTTEDGQYKAVCAVTVTQPVTGVTLDPTSLSLFTGDTATLTATVQPANATNKNVTWSTSDATVATVQDGTVTAVAAGTATITVTTTDGSNISAACTVTVKDPVYSMTTDTAVLNFDSKTEGYADAPAAKTVTITNTGNQPLTLAQPASTANFEVGTLSATELPVNGTATFTVQPKTGLAAGNYEETITVAATGGQYNVATNVTVKFAVAQKSVSGSDTSAPDDSDYYTCPACGYHNWTATDAGYRCDHCGYLESVKQLSGYANVKGTYTPGSSATTTAVTVPQTGDQSSPALWVALLSVSGLALCGLVLCRRRQH